MAVRFGVVYLDSADPIKQAMNWENVTGIVAWDREADVFGAPQNVQPLHELLDLSLPVWYGGGLETVHTAELILGLGCERVIVDKGFYKTERSPTHFVRRLGVACVPVISDEESLVIALRAGASYGYCRNVISATAASGKLNVMFEGTEPHLSWGVALLP
jgi:hypothetical protein